MTLYQALSVLLWVTSATSIWLLGWESRVLRQEKRARLHHAVEVHLALWIFFALGVRAADAFFPGSPGWTAAVITVTLGPAAALLLALGRRRLAVFPRGVLWFLAPLRGVSLWILLGFGAVRRRLRKAPPARAAKGLEEEPTSPFSLREAVQELDSLTLEEIMVPRSQVVALSGDLTPREALSRVRSARHSIYPVHEESVDHLLGLVRMLDLARPGHLDRPLRELVFASPIFPETMRALDLLGELGGSGGGSALVVDEFGSHAGFVTTEDLVEVLVGDLVGEHEVVRRRILPVEPGVYRVEGTCEIEEFNDEVEDVLPEGEYETVAGLVLEYTGRIPQPGDEVRVGRALLEVEEVTDRRILWIRVTLADSADAQQAVEA